jgi:ubiquinol-cytochrome c reductase cytochrome b subunit
VKRLERGLDERVGAAHFTRTALRRPFPDHWSFMLGEIAMFSFAILVLTGTFLAFFYRASEASVTYQGPYPPLQGLQISEALDSVLRLSFEVRAGLVMRQTHHWAAVIFILSIVTHVLRVFFTGAFRRPREINWLIGIGLLVLGLGAGFTGYSLPDDLLSGTGIRIAYSTLISIPVVGPWLAFLAFGGEFPSPGFLSRLFVFHVFLIPLLIAGGLGAHLALVWRQKHTQFRAPGRTERTVTGSPLWPNYALKSLGLFFVIAGLAALMGGLFQINPVWIFGPFHPWQASSPAQPDIYIGWLEGAYRLSPPFEPTLFGFRLPEPFIPGVVLPGAFFTLLALWPFIEARVTGDRADHHLLDRPRDAPVRTGIGVGGFTFIAVLTLAGSNDVLAKLFNVSVEAFNRATWVLLLFGAPILGYVAYRIARELGRTDLHPMSRPTRVRIRRTRDGAFDVEEDPANARSHALADEPDHPEPERDQADGPYT